MSASNVDVILMFGVENDGYIMVLVAILNLKRTQHDLRLFFNSHSLVDPQLFETVAQMCDFY